MLDRLGFEVTFAESPAPYADADLMARVDLVVQHVTNGSITDDQAAGLIGAVRAGTGLVGWHGGLAAAFRGHLDYLHMVGAQFVAHPPDARARAEGGVSSRDYTVTLAEAGHAHPITRGIGPFEVRTEQYWLLSDPLSEVLAECIVKPQPGDPWDRPVTMPVAWTRTWGAGRIFTHTLGHTMAELGLTPVQTMLERGMAWAARRRLDSAPPAP